MQYVPKSFIYLKGSISVPAFPRCSSDAGSTEEVGWKDGGAGSNARLSP